MKTILILTRNPIVNTRQMKASEGISDDGNFKFVINNLDCQPGFLVINGKAVREPKTFNVPKQRTILITDEPYDVLEYPKGYYRQFGMVITNQEQIFSYQDTNVIHTHTLLPWYVGMTWEPDHSNRITLNYNEIKNAMPEKTKLISVVSSYKTFSAGHVNRQRFVNRLIKHFGDQIDVFGEKVNDFRDKWDVTAPYKYQIVIENCRNKDYWTEKLGDCFLANTYPIYYGCTNINDYFPENSYTEIDITKPDDAIKAIEKVIEQDLFSKRQEQLYQSKMKTLDRYNFFTELANICNSITYTGDGATTINPAKKYLTLHNLYLHLLGRSLHQLSYKIRP